MNKSIGHRGEMIIQYRISMRLCVLLTVVLLNQSGGVHGGELGVLDINFSRAVFSDKLTQQSVSQSFQDSSGALWLVAEEGLNKYTGHELETYRYSATKPGSLPANNINKNY